MRAQFFLASAVGLVAGVLATARPATAGFDFGTNLIVNPGAELGTPISGGSSTLVGWTVLSGPAGARGFTGFSWTFGDGYPVYSDPGPMPPSTRGERFFYGGTNSGTSSGGQTITGPTAAEQAAVDAGLVTYDLSGWLGGFSTQNDNAVLTVEFRSGSDALLGTAQLGPVTAAQRGNATGLLFRQTLGTVPVGTRALQLTLTMTRVSGISNDGYADNLSLVLNGPTPPATGTPAPAGLVLALSGLLPLGAVARWRAESGRA